MTLDNVWAIDLPEAWFISAVSDKGRPQFKRRIAQRGGRLHGSKFSCSHRVSWLDWVGGWVVEDLLTFPGHPQRILFNNQPFPTYMAAILATEVELSNLK